MNSVVPNLTQLVKTVCVSGRVKTKSVECVNLTHLLMEDGSDLIKPIQNPKSPIQNRYGLLGTTVSSKSGSIALARASRTALINFPT